MTYRTATDCSTIELCTHDLFFCLFQCPRIFLADSIHIILDLKHLTHNAYACLWYIWPMRDTDVRLQRFEINNLGLWVLLEEIYSLLDWGHKEDSTDDLLHYDQLLYCQATHLLLVVVFIPISCIKDVLSIVFISS